MHMNKHVRMRKNKYMHIHINKYMHKNKYITYVYAKQHNKDDHLG